MLWVFCSCGILLKKDGRNIKAQKVIEMKIFKEKIGKTWYYYLKDIEIEGITFSIALSKNQLLKIKKAKDKTRLHVDVFVK